MELMSRGIWYLYPVEYRAYERRDMALISGGIWYLYPGEYGIHIRGNRVLVIHVWVSLIRKSLLKCLI